MIFFPGKLITIPFSDAKILEYKLTTYSLYTFRAIKSNRLDTTVMLLPVAYASPRHIYSMG
jgi:hypothetical protein